jgi:hypothetical protein
MCQPSKCIFLIGRKLQQSRRARQKPLGVLLAGGDSNVSCLDLAEAALAVPAEHVKLEEPSEGSPRLSEVLQCGIRVRRSRHRVSKRAPVHKLRVVVIG